MSKDYKSYSSQKKKSSGKKFGTVKPLWWLVIVVIVILLSTVLLIKSHEKISQKIIIQPIKKLAQPVKPKTEPIKFEFYKMLSDQSVNLPSSTNNIPQTTVVQSTYIVQIASLKDPKVADNFKAKLALKGFNPQVKTIQSQSGTTWYRVQIGPYNNFDDAFDAQNNLRKANFDGLIKKLK